ncbi:MAG: MFS transporter [Gammaproteobacteria bacterium]|nr:MFS transporter [Gammaproteobacteria bacterium]
MGNAERIDIARLIDGRPMSAAQRLVVAVCVAAMIVCGYGVQVMGLAVPALAAGWALPPSSFGLALSAMLVGLTVGSGLLGPLADRYGRRALLIAALVATGLFTAGTALSTTPTQFAAWRLATGIAVGAGLPACAALTAEYAPASYRSFVMGVLNAGAPAGAFAAGILAPPILAAFGWQGVFVIGGVVPLLLAALASAAPESLKFLYARRPASADTAATLQRVVPGIDPAGVCAATEAGGSGGGVLGLLRPPLRARTLLLWGMVGLNLFNLYVLVSWLPTLLSAAGWSMAAALRGAVLIQAGGVLGGLLIARLMDAGATRGALVGGFCLSAACLLLFNALPSGVSWVALLLLLGAGVSGSQLALSVLSAAYYPPAIKATGVSWAIVVGGIGSMAAPLAGAWLLDRHMGPMVILALLALPALLNALAVALMRREWQSH